MSQTVLLIGQTGQVGHELARSLLPLGKLIGVDRRTLDVADQMALRTLIRTVNPDVIVNAAAYTAVDQAEHETERANQINHLAPHAMAEEAYAIGAMLVHYSTDYVFDGALTDRAYLETDHPAPLNEYGRSKLAGEVAIRETGARHVIFRTSWVIGSHGSNFLRTMLRLMHERETVSVVVDQIGAPTWSRLIADVTALVVHAMLQRPDAGDDGIYHLQSAGVTSWHGVAVALLEGLHRRDHPGIACKQVIPLASHEYPTPAARPKNSRLDCTRLTDTSGIQLPNWKPVLDACLTDVLASGQFARDGTGGTGKPTGRA